MKIDIEAIKKSIAEVKASCGKSEKVEYLFCEENGEIKFSGHTWGKNCVYGIDDLQKNGDFKVVYNPDGDLEAQGTTINLTQAQLESLRKLTDLVEAI